ncbi:MAG: transglycosylase SLT domain-containing protein [Thermoanaerobaculia bacterium]
MNTLIPLALMFLSAPAMAGTVYRCVGTDGVPNYTSKRASNAICKAITTSSDQSRLSRFSPKAATPAPVAAPVAGAVTATATVANPDKQVVFQTTAGGSVPAAAPKLAAGARVLRGSVYRYEKDGVTHYTNVRPRGMASAKMLFSYVEACYACSALPGVNFGKISLNTSSYSAEIHSAASEYGVEEAIVRAIIHAESAYRANAVSRAGARGLMQLIPATASRFGVTDSFDPGQNIKGGVKYLAFLLKRYNSNLTLAAAAYNAGEGAVDRNGGVPPYAETQRYVQRVGQLADRYRTALAGP